MKLLYLSETNLRDRLFIKDLIFNFKLKEKVLLLHDVFGDSIRDTRFVTKRISALLSENMVYNNAFSAEQRNLFAYEGEDQLIINTQLIAQLFQTVSLLILSPVIKKGDQVELADPIQMIQAARHQLEANDLILFTDNPLSPLAKKGEYIEEKADQDRLMKIYDEEAAAIQLAYKLRPARIASPVNYSL